MTRKELKDGWDKVLILMKDRVDQLVINAFLSPLTPCKLSEKEQKLYLYAPKESNYAFYQNSVKNHLSDLTECINVVFGRPYSVEVTEKETDQEPEDTYFAQVGKDGSIQFPTGNIFGDREMVCAVPDAGEQVRIRLETPYLRPSVKDIPSLRLHEDQYSALVNRKNALYTISGADTLYQFLPRRQDLLLSGVTWERYHLDDYTRFHSVQEIIVEILPSVRLRRGQLEVAVPDGAGATRQFKDRVLVMMDGVIIPDIRLLLNLDAMLLDDVFVCTETLVSNFLLYNGVVNFVSKKNYVKALNFPENVFVLDFKGVRYPVAYPGAVPAQGRDVRQLLYWHPGLHIQEGETMRLSLTAPAYPGLFCVVAEGLSSDGKPVRAVTTFEVE